MKQVQCRETFSRGDCLKVLEIRPCGPIHDEKKKYQSQRDHTQKSSDFGFYSTVVVNIQIDLVAEEIEVSEEGLEFVKFGIHGMGLKN